jgi:[ribosomal protein S5]-alanine N-acetyltransferase
MKFQDFYKKMVQIEFEIRPWLKSDLHSLVKYANNFNIAKNLTDKFPHPYTETDGESFIEMASMDYPIHIFTIEVNSEAVGGIGVYLLSDIHRKNAELGYWLAEPYWGKGIISKAIKQIIDFTFLTYDIDRVFAKPFGTNIASQKVLEKNNFILEGHFENVIFKNGEYLDELVYAFRRENWLR